MHVITSSTPKGPTVLLCYQQASSLGNLRNKQMVKALVFLDFKRGGALENKYLYADHGTIFYNGEVCRKSHAPLLK